MPRINKITVVFDTNTYISACISRNFRRKLFQILTDNRFRIVYCNELLDEFEAVIVRRKFLKYITLQQANRFLSLVIEKLSFVPLITFVRISRDANDNYLLSLAFDSKAKYLVTGDEDLLVLKKFGNTHIISFSEFCSQYDI